MKKVYILATIMAIIAGIAVYYFANALQKKNVVEDVNKGQVIVTLADVPENTMITEEMVTIKELPVEAIHPMALSSFEQVIGAITKNPLVAGEQVLLSKLGEQGETAEKLSYSLDPGQRAVSVAVDEVSGVSGYISVGDYVDVVATLILQGGVGEPNRAISVLLVENLLVVETGVEQSGSANDPAVVYETVTLSATPNQVLKINYASTNGSVRLVLRPVLDDKEWDLPYYEPIY